MDRVWPISIKILSEFLNLEIKIKIKESVSSKKNGDEYADK